MKRTCCQSFPQVLLVGEDSLSTSGECHDNFFCRHLVRRAGKRRIRGELNFAKWFESVITNYVRNLRLGFLIPNRISLLGYVFPPISSQTNRSGIVTLIDFYHQRIDYFLHGKALKGTDDDNAAAKRWPRRTNCRTMFGTRKNRSKNRMLIISLIHASFLEKRFFAEIRGSRDWK